MAAHVPVAPPRAHRDVTVGPGRSAPPTRPRLRDGAADHLATCGEDLSTVNADDGARCRDELAGAAEAATAARAAAAVAFLVRWDAEEGVVLPGV